MQGGGRDPFNFGGSFGGPFGGFGGPFSGPGGSPLGGFGGSFGGPGGSPLGGLGGFFGGSGASLGVPGGSFDGFGGTGDPRSLISNFFGGRTPFDDFNQPFGGMIQPNFFVSSIEDTFANILPSGHVENHPPDPTRSRGPIIEEIDSDDEKEGEDEGRRNILGKHGRSRTEEESADVAVEVNAEQGPPQTAKRSNRQTQSVNRNAMVNTEQWPPHFAERRNSQMQSISRNAMVNTEQWLPQTRSFSFQSSTVTYGGQNGTYVTSSKTRRIGSDGVTFEESREANSATREAAHKISRGLHNQGHTVARELRADGQVNTMQTLHNLNEDELPAFEQSWTGSAGRHLSNSSGFLNGGGVVNREQPLGLPSTDPRMTVRSSSTRAEPSRRRNPAMNSRGSNGHPPQGGHGYGHGGYM